MKKKWTKKTLATLGATLAMLALLLSSILSLVSFTHSVAHGIEFTSQTYIVDNYGKLDKNTQYVLETTLEEAFKESGYQIFFSYVYEDINESYMNSLSSLEDTIFIFYNASTQKIDVVSKVKFINDNFEITLESDEQLEKSIPSFVDSICANIEEPSDNVYINNLVIKSFGSVVWAFVGALVFGSFLKSYIEFVRDYIELCKTKKDIKKRKQEEAQQEEAIIESIEDSLSGPIPAEDLEPEDSKHENPEE